LPDVVLKPNASCFVLVDSANTSDEFRCFHLSGILLQRLRINDEMNTMTLQPTAHQEARNSLDVRE
jgi:hypothetical protein